MFANQQKDELTNRNSAIVINPSVTVRSTPSESGTSLFILHEGHKVGVKDGSMKVEGDTSGRWKSRLGTTSAIEII